MENALLRLYDGFCLTCTTLHCREPETKASRALASLHTLSKHTIRCSAHAPKWGVTIMPERAPT